MLDACTNRKARKPPDGDVVFVQRQFDLDSHVRSPSLKEMEEIHRPKNAAMLADQLYLLLEHCSAAISTEDHKRSDGPLTRMEVLVQATSCVQSVKINDHQE